MLHKEQMRKTFTKFRIGFTQILKHKRRYTDENAAILRCPLCNDETENEVHLLTTCGWYDHTLQKFL